MEDCSLPSTLPRELGTEARPGLGGSGEPALQPPGRWLWARCQDPSEGGSGQVSAWRGWSRAWDWPPRCLGVSALGALTLLVAAPQLTMNDFSVHRIIGRGGFGEVYGCRKADTGKM